jgi:hypothetical protein
METANQITNWLSLTVIIIAFIITLYYRNRKNLIPIKLYIIVSIVANLVLNIFDSFFSKSHHRNVEQAAFNIYSLIEFSLIYYFLFVRIKGKWFRTVMFISLCLYISICILSWSLNYRIFFSFTPDLLGVEGILITISCLFYIYEILKTDLNVDLKSDANFIATCGILFYFSLSIPTYFSWYNLHYLAPGFEKITILANSIFYTILFISFMKAYICPIPNQK